MKRSIKYAVTLVALAAVLGATAGCTRVRLQDDPRTKTVVEAKSYPLSGATTLTADIAQGVGDLKVRPSADTTTDVRASFVFSPESWRPETTFSVDASTAVFRVRMPSDSSSPTFSHNRNSWTIDLPAGVPTDLKLRLGVGTSQVDLRGVDLTALDAVTGVGSTTIDLSGPRTTGLTARVEAGIGELTIRLPRGVGVRVTSANDGVGHVSAKGFTENGTELTNSAWTGTGPAIDIDLVRGVGDVTLVLVD